MAELHSGTQAIDRASSLLIHVLESETPPLLTELARIYGLPKSTTSRILSALERQGLLLRDRNGAYIAGSVLTQFDTVCTWAKPRLHPCHAHALNFRSTSQ